MKRGFVIAAVSSGSGKTTVSNGLMRALSRRGITVHPFKVGPDYIDTQFHKVASGNDSINLDAFMSSENHVKELFNRYSAEDSSGEHISIVEGVMGLFDGYDRKSGSAAHIAKLTGLPVVLVINARSSAYSLAALLQGFRTFDPEVNVAGVIFNNVASATHLELLKKAAEDGGVRMLGYVWRDDKLAIPSRHLGLSIDTEDVIAQFVDAAGDAVEHTVDLDALLELREEREERKERNGNRDKREKSEKRDKIGDSEDKKKYGRRIAVAHDDAFNFIYPENLRSLENDPTFGGEIIEFSPLKDEKMPDADFLYLPGGYPELFAERLSANIPMMESIREYIEKGGFAWAECGGLLYLAKAIDGMPMCNVIPITATMDGASLTLGYRTIQIGEKEFRGHEFHYSHVKEEADIPKVGYQTNLRGERVATPLYNYKNLIAGYTHLYWGEIPLSEVWKVIKETAE